MGGPPPAASAKSTVKQEHIYTLAEKDDLLRINQPALDALRAGLGKRYLAPPLRSFDSLVSYLGLDRSLARLLRLEAETYAERGEWAKAVNSGLDALELGTQIEQSAPVMGYLSGIACEAIGRSAIWDNIGHLTAAEAATAARRLEKMSLLRPAAADCLTEEKSYTIAGWVDLMRKPGWRWSDGRESSNLAIYVSSLRYSKTQIVNLIAAHFDHAISNAREPYLGSSEQAYSEPPAGPPLLQMLMPEFSQLKFKGLVNDAENRLLATSLALHAYKQQHGEYPQSLTYLEPKYLSSIPRDPFGSTISPPGLKYLRTEGTFALWSVGPDLTDSGGFAIKNSQQGSSITGTVLAESSGDIVAGVNLN
jgi:hypothetical protein